MSVIIMNPGTEAVPNATREHAIKNMSIFLADCEIEDLSFVSISERDYGDGRYAFLVWKNTRCHEIQMPGLPLHKVRFMGEDDQNAWDFPRLYIDGSSWLWKYALLDSEEDWKEEFD